MTRDRVEEVSRVLPVRLKQHERLDRAVMMSEHMNRRDELEREAKRTADRYKDDVKQMAGTIRDLQIAVKTGYEDRPVDCVWSFNFSVNKKSLIRQDTGDIVEEHALTEAERQLAADLTPYRQDEAPVEQEPQA